MKWSIFAFNLAMFTFLHIKSGNTKLLRKTKEVTPGKRVSLKYFEPLKLTVINLCYFNSVQLLNLVLVNHLGHNYMLVIIAATWLVCNIGLTALFGHFRLDYQGLAKAQQQIGFGSSGN